MESVVEDAPTRFAFPEPARLAPPMLTLERGRIGYGGRVVLRGLSLRIDMDDRIALLGANGNGKSTFAKLIAGRLAPLRGRMQHSPKLRVGYFAQHQTDELVADETPVQHMARALPQALPTAVRAQLARFGLDADRADTPTRDLSGGEKARLLLALATRDAPQLLILDEPTNHLDLDARDALIRALAEFEGAVLLISHDPHLVELVADRLWLVGDGRVAPFEGDMADYRTLAGRARPGGRARGAAGAGRLPCPGPRRGPPGSRRAATRHGTAAQACPGCGGAAGKAWRRAGGAGGEAGGSEALPVGWPGGRDHAHEHSARCDCGRGGCRRGGLDGRGAGAGGGLMK